jgi:hypothetical protein
MNRRLTKRELIIFEIPAIKEKIAERDCYRPDERRRIPANDVAWVMNAQIYARKADRKNQRRG